jgi:hypothetical protein
LKKVNSLEISIIINKDGVPVKISFWSKGDKNKYFETLSNKIKKYIIDNCRWRPGYKIVKNRKVYISVSQDYIIK